MDEKGENKVQTDQPVIPHDSYLASYVTALDLCLQGIISPSTLGIDTKKLDNAEAQREKEKTTLYTRNAIVEALQEAGIEFTDDQVTWIDFNNDETKAQSTAADFLTAHPDSRKILFGVLTDPASAGVLAAIETAKRSDDCMIVSHGGEDVGIEMLKKDNCFQGTVCYDPAKYGEGLIPLAVRIIHGEQAEVYNYAQQYMLTRDNLG